MLAELSRNQLDARGAMRAASIMMQALYEQRIVEMQALMAKQDSPIAKKLAQVWEKVLQISDNQAEAIVIFADLMTHELDHRVTVVVA